MTDRCAWAGGSQLEQAYHDQEWGVPTHDDRLLFEFLILEGAQAGLSWKTILNKRDGYRRAFDQFNVHEVAQYDDQKQQELMQNSADRAQQIEDQCRHYQCQGVSRGSGEIRELRQLHLALHRWPDHPKPLVPACRYPS